MASEIINQLNQILPKIFCNNNKNDIIATEITPLSVANSGAYFLTSIFKIKLQLNRDNQPLTLNLLCKSVSSDDEMAIELQQDLMFHNEILFYNEYASELPSQIVNMIPKYYYGNMKGLGGKPCVILEFMEEYSMSNSKVFLPSDHIAQALKSLGEFHGFGYVMKETKPQKFMEICNRIVEIKYEEVPKDMAKMLRVNRFVKVCSQRGFQHIPNVDEYSDVIDKYKAVFSGVSNVSISFRCSFLFILLK